MSRLGYALDIDQLAIPSRNEKTEKLNKWYGRFASALDFVADIDLPNTPVHIPLSKFSEEKLESLKNDWHKLTGDLSVAGLRYWWGNPVVFFAKVIEQEKVADIEVLFEHTHDAFHHFAQKYPAYISESGYNICDMCFAFPDSQAFQEASAKIRKNKGGFWKDTYTFGWFLDLNTLDLVTTKGLAPVHLKAVENAALFVRRNHKAQSLDDWKKPNRFVTGGILGPKTYLQFLRLYLRLHEEDRLPLPAEFTPRKRKDQDK
jgi:hypothetical protein